MTNFSIKFKLILTFIITIIFMLLCVLFYSIYIISYQFKEVKNNLTSNIEELSQDINNGIKNRTDELIKIKEEEVNAFLRNSSIMAKYIIRLETENLMRRIKIIAEKDEIRNAVIHGLFRSGNLKAKDYKNKEYTQEYQKSNSKLKYLFLLNDQKTSGWPGRETGIALELFDKNGEIKARTDLKKEFRERDNSEHIQKILATNMYAELSKTISNEDGLAIKVYSRVNENFSPSEGGLIGTIYFDSYFADLLKNHTGTEIIIYNKERFFATSFFDKGKRLNFRNREDLYKKFESKEIKDNFENMKIDFAGSNQFYRIYYTPIFGDNEVVIGMIAHCIDIKSIENIKMQLLNEEMSTFSKFERIINHIVLDIARDETNMKKSFFINLTIMIILFLIIFTVVFDLIISKIIINTIKKVSNGLKELSEGKGKLGFLKVKSKDEVGELAGYFNNFVDNLNFVVTEIKDGAMVIATSTMEINSGNKILVEKAEEQSESIQKTFINISEIKNIVKKNAGITVIVNGMTENAKKIAEDVSLSTKELKKSMKLIKESSQQIEKILSVLDEITFQTNLLAINAAVESARAGEYGRGFNVVATEIRNLAQRSSKAAKQIKTLIHENVEKVDIGDVSAKNTIDDIEKIIEEVKNINNIIAGMASGTEKQNEDIEGTVSEIEKIKNMTQDNEDIIKDMFEMTEILNKKAFEFRELVNFFAADNTNQNKKIKEIKNEKGKK